MTERYAVCNNKQGFSYSVDQNYVFSFLYNESSATRPLDDNDADIINITGDDGEEDVVQSAPSADFYGGKP